jgi:hypothetical protein
VAYEVPLPQDVAGSVDVWGSGSATPRPAAVFAAEARAARSAAAAVASGADASARVAAPAAPVGATELLLRRRRAALGAHSLGAHAAAAGEAESKPFQICKGSGSAVGSHRVQLADSCAAALADILAPALHLLLLNAASGSQPAPLRLLSALPDGSAQPADVQMGAGLPASAAEAAPAVFPGLLLSSLDSARSSSGPAPAHPGAQAPPPAAAAAAPLPSGITWLQLSHRGSGSREEALLLDWLAVDWAKHAPQRWQLLLTHSWADIQRRVWRGPPLAELQRSYYARHCAADAGGSGIVLDDEAVAAAVREHAIQHLMLQGLLLPDGSPAGGSGSSSNDAGGSGKLAPEAVRSREQLAPMGVDLAAGAALPLTAIPLRLPSTEEPCADPLSAEYARQLRQYGEALHGAVAAADGFAWTDGAGPGAAGSGGSAGSARSRGSGSSGMALDGAEEERVSGVAALSDASRGVPPSPAVPSAICVSPGAAGAAALAAAEATLQRACDTVLARASTLEAVQVERERARQALERERERLARERAAAAAAERERLERLDRERRAAAAAAMGAPGYGYGYAYAGMQQQQLQQQLLQQRQQQQRAAAYGSAGAGAAGAAPGAGVAVAGQRGGYESMPPPPARGTRAGARGARAARGGRGGAHATAPAALPSAPAAPGAVAPPPLSVVQAQLQLFPQAVVASHMAALRVRADASGTREAVAQHLRQTGMGLEELLTRQLLVNLTNLRNAQIAQAAAAATAAAASTAAASAAASAAAEAGAVAPRAASGVGPAAGATGAPTPSVPAPALTAAASQSQEAPAPAAEAATSPSPDAAAHGASAAPAGRGGRASARTSQRGAGARSGAGAGRGR